MTYAEKQKIIEALKALEGIKKEDYLSCLRNKSLSSGGKRGQRLRRKM